jgi:Ferritin-like domain/TAT (twin-arginine translocation) pathway signal sequence
MNDETIPMTQDDEIVSPGFSRRNFLVAGGVTAAAVVATPYLGKVAFAGASTSNATATKGSAKRANNDLATAAFAASLEALAVSTYQAAYDAAVANKLGAVPPVGTIYLLTAISQHREQLASWNSVLTANGKPEVTEPNPELKTTVDARFAEVTDFGGAVTLARDLEEIAAATYLSAIPTLKSKDAIELAGSINIIDMQHVAILNYVLGEYPVPDTFAKTTKAATP